MDVPQFSGFVNRSLVETIDRLFACKVGEYIDLPQIVVVGDQSSGKSLVLAVLTGIPFSRDSGLCTRFATQIIFKKNKETVILISIISGLQSSNEHIEKVNKWHRNEQTLDSQTFANVLDEAAAVMGVGKQGTGVAAFSSDVLRIEICGPQQEHFSVIDVPGLFRKTVEGVTNKEDRDMVDEIVSMYMKNSRSIMLTVIPANVDIATQEILERAAEVDPEGMRTLGILTKPDLVDKGAEKIVMDMLEGRQHKQRLGWHLLRNPGKSELFESRKQIEEEFFRNHAPWSGLDADRIGVVALEVRLQQILADHLRREFPKVKQEISQRLKETNLALQELGPRRESHNELTHFALDLATKFQGLVSFAIGGQYRQIDKFHELAALRLATNVVNRSESFALTMEKIAHAFEFVSGEAIKNSSTINNLGLKKDKGKLRQEQDVKKESQSISHTRLIPTEIDVAHIVLENSEIAAPNKTGIMDWLNTICIEFRGFELGTLNSQLVGVAIKIQTEKWRDIALGYVSDIVCLVHSFILAALKHVAPNDRIFANPQSLLVDQLSTMYERALSHTEFLLQIELNGMPATHNALFLQTLASHRKRRTEKEEQSAEEVHDTQGPWFTSKSTVTHSDYANEIHDILQAYYSVSRTRFVDNVRMQACNYYLVECTNTEKFIRPLELFSAKFMTSLTPERLEEVVGEDSDVKRKRKKLEREIEQLTLGKQATEQSRSTHGPQREDEQTSTKSSRTLGFTGIASAEFPSAMRRNIQI